jgi:hypothetical protein
VYVGLKFWFRPVWLEVEDEDSGFCLDEVVQSNIQYSSDSNRYLNSHEINHRNQILLYCKIYRFDDYVIHSIQLTHFGISRDDYS